MGTLWRAIRGPAPSLIEKIEGPSRFRRPSGMQTALTSVKLIKEEITVHGHRVLAHAVWAASNLNDWEKKIQAWHFVSMLELRFGFDSGESSTHITDVNKKNKKKPNNLERWKKTSCAPWTGSRQHMVIFLISVIFVFTLSTHTVLSY